MDHPEPVHAAAVCPLLRRSPLVDMSTLPRRQLSSLTEKESRPQILSRLCQVVLGSLGFSEASEKARDSKFDCEILVFAGIFANLLS